MRIGFLAIALLLVLPAAAAARVVRAETVLPPGQSGFVSITGVPTGTGSPHLGDQRDLFVGFRYKPALFDQPGTTEQPRAGVRIVRDSYGVPAVTAATMEDAWWGVGYASRKTGCSRSSCSGARRPDGSPRSSAATTSTTT